MTQLFLNCEIRFWPLYRGRPGSIRRKALLALFQQYPEGLLPVNCKWQASTKDVDLAILLKKGLLSRERPGRGRRHHMNKSSNKRQTYLRLARAA